MARIESNEQTMAAPQCPLFSHICLVINLVSWQSYLCHSAYTQAKAFDDSIITKESNSYDLQDYIAVYYYYGYMMIGYSGLTFE